MLFRSVGTVATSPSVFDSELALSSPLKRIGSKPIKPGRRKALGKQISKLILSGNEFNEQVTPEDLFTNKMIVNFYVLCAN